MGSEVHAAVALPVQCEHSKALNPNQFPRDAGASQLLSIQQSIPTSRRQQQSAGSSPQLSGIIALHSSGKLQGSSTGSLASLHFQGSSAGCRADAECASQQMVSPQRSTMDAGLHVQLADETASSTADTASPGHVCTTKTCGSRAGLQQQISTQALIALEPGPQQQQCGSLDCAQQSPPAPVKLQAPVCDTDCCKPISNPPCTSTVDSMQASSDASCPQCYAVDSSQLALQGIKAHQQAAMAAEVRSPTQAAGTDLRHSWSLQLHSDPLVSHEAQSEKALQTYHSNSPDVSASVLLPQTTSQAPHQQQPLVAAPHRQQPVATAPQQQQPIVAAPHRQQSVAAAPHWQQSAAAAPHRQQPVAAAAPLQLDGTSVEVAQHDAVLDMRQEETPARQIMSDASAAHLASSWLKTSQADTCMQHSNGDVHSHGAMHAVPLESSLLAQAGTEPAADSMAEAATSGSSTDDTHRYGLKSCCMP